MAMKFNLPLDWEEMLVELQEIRREMILTAPTTGHRTVTPEGYERLSILIEQVADNVRLLYGREAKKKRG